MATPNYGYEKRQKELAKKRKKEDKLKEKAQRRQGGGADSGGRPADGDAALPPEDAGSGSPGAA